MQSRRHQRVRELLIRAIGEVLRREMPINQAGLVTVTDVGLSGDLHSAAVFVSIFGTESQQKKSLGFLRKQTKRLQTIMGRTVVLKYTPQLRFVIDEAMVRGNRVLTILDELKGSLPDEDEAAT